MAIGKLYIGPVDFNFNSSSTQLVSKDNLKSSIKSHNVSDYHTSIEDLSLDVTKNDVRFLLKNIREIEFVDVENYLNSEKYKNVTLSRLCCLLIIEFCHLIPSEELKKKVFNYWIKSTLLSRANKKSSLPSLWVAGCSFSSASGVSDKERWGHLVAEELGLEEINLAIVGGSILDASNQIFNSDIQKDDTVIWGLTNLNRLDMIFDDHFESLTAPQALGMEVTRKYFNLDFFDSPDQKVTALIQIHHVVQHCKKIGAKLYLVDFLAGEWASMAFDREDNFLDLCKDLDNLLDYGTDDEHPGPLQHKEYAEKIIKLIQGE